MVSVYSFNLGEKPTEMSPEVLGGKGAGLVWMAANGFRTPPGIILPVEVWQLYKAKPKSAMKQVEELIEPWLLKLKQHFGYMPLLSVRSGARVSCPGMMDTILNVGLDSTTESFWRKKMGDAAYEDSFHRLVVMYGNVVHGIPRQQLENAPISSVVSEFTKASKEPFPMARKQLLCSVEAVFKSWDNERAKFYRKLNNIPDEWGTACVIQAMVFGNLNDNSGTGVLFTRNPDSGLAKITGDFLPNAQGEDVVAGTVTPADLHEDKIVMINEKPVTVQSMSSWNPEVYQELLTSAMKLEQLRKDVQDIEFTVQDGVLYMLQTRSAKRSALASLVIAHDMLDEGLLSEEEVVSRVPMVALDKAVQPTISPEFSSPPWATGLPACSGIVSGRVVYSAEEAASAKDPVILVAEETTPDDIAGMYKAVGVLTLKGGYTSHAAVVMRGMNKPCIVALGMAIEDFKAGVPYGTKLSMDGSTGNVWKEEVPIVKGDGKIIDRHLGIVRKVKKFSPILFSAPEHSLESAWLVLGELVLDPSSAAQVVKQAKTKVANLIVDLDPKDEDQVAFMKMMGYNSKDYAELAAQLIAQIPSMEGLTFSATHPFGLPALKTVTSLQEAILATEPMVLPFVSDAAMQKVLKWKVEEGVPVVSFGVKVPGGSAFLTYAAAFRD